MSEREKQFLNLYRKYRYEDQQRYYESRLPELEAARNQVITLNIAFIVAAAVAAVLASVSAGEWKLFWAVLAVIFPVLATALSAYEGLYAFERQAKLYRDAVDALYRARVAAPDLKPGLTEADYHDALNAYVNEVESIFRREQGQWGQLINEITLSEPPPG